MTSRSCFFVAFLSLVAAGATWAGQINEHWTVTFGERLRLETWDNTISLNNDSADANLYTRSRTLLGTVWSPSPKVTLGLRLGNEFRYYVAPKNRDFDLHEVFVDQLYARAALPWYKPLSFTVGRQDIALGEGFIMMDGTPRDGSRSVYFNAVRLDWTIRPDHLLTAFVCREEETDDWLPLIHDMDQLLVEQPETGIGVHYAGKWSKTEIQGYLIRKETDDNRAIPFSSSTNTVGGRIKRPVLSSIDLTAVMEAAYQFGKRGDVDRQAFGGYGYVQYRPAWKTPCACLPSLLAAGVIFLSGDDTETDNWEGWDPMFGRWPKWSDSYIYAEVKEDAVAWWTNLLSINAEVRFLPSSSTELRLAFHHLIAPRKADTLSFPGGTGTTRGELVIAKLSYKFDQRWSGHLLCEGFNPGNYYFDGADSYAWIRAELMYAY